MDRGHRVGGCRISKAYPGAYDCPLTNTNVNAVRHTGYRPNASTNVRVATSAYTGSH